MHANLYSGNLLTLLAKTFGQPWRQLLQLYCNRTAVGVNDHFAALEIGDVGARQQVGGQGRIQQNLQSL